MALQITKLSFLALITSILLFSGCGGGDSTNNKSTQTDWHYQGRDCLSCHNVDLKESKHLTFGGTIYKRIDINNSDDLDQVCDTTVKLLLMDTSGNIIVDTSLTQDKNSSGFLGKGNFFVLKRDLPSITGRYIVKIVNDQNKLITSSTIHSFNTEFNKEKPADNSNRYSCNSCHNIPSKNRAPGRLYAYDNSLCK